MTADGVLVDVIIPVHDLRRPLARAVDSVLRENRSDVRVTVVCHGLKSDLFKRDPALKDPRVRFAEFVDGISSPAGPMNHGLKLATGHYVCRLDSDDFLAPGALNAWLAYTCKYDLDVLFAGLQQQSGERVRNPQVRPWRTRGLDPLKDRLYTRAAPLGLVRLSAIQASSLEFEPTFATGEDIAFTTELITKSSRIGFARHLPPYVIGNDVAGRVTSTRWPFDALAAPVRHVARSTAFQDLPGRTQDAIIRARLNTSILPDVFARRTPDRWTPGDVESVTELFRWVKLRFPGSLTPLPRAQRTLIDILSEGSPETSDAAEAVQRWWRSRRTEHLLPRKMRHVLHRDGTVRRYALKTLARVGA